MTFSSNLGWVCPVAPLLLAIFFTLLWAVGHAIISRRKGYRYQSTETSKLIVRGLAPRFVAPPISLEIAIFFVPLSLAIGGVVTWAVINGSPLNQFVEIIFAYFPPSIAKICVQLMFIIILALLPGVCLLRFLRIAYQFHETVVKVENGCCPFCGYATWASVENGGKCSECGAVQSPTREDHLY